MKKILLTATCAFALLTTTSPAHADPKPWIFSWGFGHFSNLDFTQRYLGNGKDLHDRQWDDKKWNPDVWIAQEKEGLDLIHGFYQGGIFEDQKLKNGIPYLSVGPNFYKLGGYDQRRVVQTVDAVYQITSADSDDMFYLYDNMKGGVIGLYTKHGLQLH